MKKRSKKNPSVPTEESNGSTKSNASSKGSSKSSPRDGLEVKIKKKEKHSDDYARKRNSMNITLDRIKTDSIKKSNSYNFEQHEDIASNQSVSIRKTRSRSEAFPVVKKKNRIKSTGTLGDIQSIMTDLTNSISKLENALLEEKSNRVIFQILVKNQEEAIQELKAKLEVQDMKVEEMQTEILDLKFQLEKVGNKKKDKKKTVKKIKSEGKLQTFLKPDDKKDKKSAKKTKSHPIMIRRVVKSPRDRKETSSGFSTPRNEYDNTFEFESMEDGEPSTPKSDHSEGHYEKRVSLSGEKKSSKKDLKSTFFLNFKSNKSKQELKPSSPREVDDGGYLSEGSTNKRVAIQTKRSSAPRLLTQPNISSPYLGTPSPSSTSDRSISPDPLVTRIPRPYMIFPDKYKDELSIPSPTPRSLAAAISSWTLNAKGIPIHLEQWASILVTDGYNLPDLFTKEISGQIPSMKQGSPSHFTPDDCYSIAAAFKSWFIELPDSLFMTSKYTHWANAVQIEDDVRICFLKTLYYSLEETNRVLLQFVFEFFEALLSRNNGSITIESISHAFGPIFLRDVNSVYSNRIGVTFGDLLAQRETPRKEKNKALKAHLETASNLISIILNEKTFFDDDRDAISFVKIGRQYVITSATVENLILLLIDTNYTEREFSHIFWTTSSYFISSTSFLKMLIDLYDRYEGLSKWKANIRMRVLMTIKTWVKSYAETLSRDIPFKQMFFEFTTKAKEDDVHIKTSNETQMLQSLANAQLLEIDAPSGITLPPRQVVSPNNMIVDQYDSKVFATQVVLIHSEIISSIEHTELLDVGTTHKELKKMTNYTTVVDFINNLTMWVAYDILKNSHVNGRIRAISYFIDVAHHCLLLHDYNGAWVIYGAIGLHIIQRLTTTWERVPKKDMMQYKKLELLFEPRMNFVEYRKRYEQSIKEAGYAIPILALIPMDIIRYEVEPTYKERRQIDFVKMRKIYATLQTISASNTKPLNTTAHDLKVVEKLWNWIWNYKDVDEVALEEMSKSLEPKQG